MSRYDVIVIGAGHNGLTAAALLAKSGRKVLVVERRDVVGGLAVSEEFHPGYRTVGALRDTSSVRSWVLEKLGISDVRRASDASLFVPESAERGPGLLLDSDPGRAESEFARWGAPEAEAYRDYRRFVQGVRDVVRRLTDRVPPDILEPGLGDLLALGRSGAAVRLLGRERMMELLRVAPMSVDDWLREHFEAELVRTALAGRAVRHAVVGPRAPASAADLLVAECTSERPWVGGAPALVGAIEASARQQGVEIRTGSAVQALQITDDRVTGATLASGDVVEASTVAASCDPKHLFLDLIPATALSRSFEHEISCFRTRGSAAIVHLALSRYPSFACRPEIEPAWIRIGETIDELERAADAIKYREMSERPVLEVYILTLEAGDLAPEGHHVASIRAQYVPYDLEGGWTAERREDLYQRVVARFAEVASELEAAIVGSEVLTPVDLEERYRVSGGHLYHGEHALDQRLVRPAPGCTRYATPIEGLFLCGSGAHPGGGLTCVPGALAAQVILER